MLLASLQIMKPMLSLCYACYKKTDRLAIVWPFNWSSFGARFLVFHWLPNWSHKYVLKIQLSLLLGGQHNWYIHRHKTSEMNYICIDIRGTTASFGFSFQRLVITLPHLWSSHIIFPSSPLFWSTSAKIDVHSFSRSPVPI